MGTPREELAWKISPIQVRSLSALAELEKAKDKIHQGKLPFKEVSRSIEKLGEQIAALQSFYTHLETNPPL